MALSPSVKSRKADALHARLVKGHRDHEYGLRIMTWVSGEEIVLLVKAEHAPALEVREWLSVDFGGHELYRIAQRWIGKALKKEADRRVEQAAWEAAAARASH